MALLWFDGFDRYGTQAALQMAYPDAGPSVQFASGRYGGGSLVLPKGTGTNHLAIPLPVVSNTLVMGFALKLNAFCRFCLVALDTTSSPMSHGLYVTANGQFEFWASPGYVQSLGTYTGGMTTYSTLSIAPGVWNYIELVVKLGQPNGSGGILLRVNEKNAIDITNVWNADPYTGFSRATWLSSANANIDAYIDDAYIMNEQGGCNTLPVGNVVAETRFPTGNELAQWTAVPGSYQTWQCIGETPPDGDTTYAYTQGQESFERYTTGNLQYVAGPVYGIKASAVARKDSSYYAGIVPFCNGFAGPQGNLTQGYQTYSAYAGYQSDHNYQMDGAQSAQSAGPQYLFDISQVQGSSFNFGANRRDDNLS